ncbi:MAG: excinuclease ABC subunit UvrA [Pirellulaceae bacterium]|nr:excinuclease ABC subunit UvrA [Pirellulaceae bacterium]
MRGLTEADSRHSRRREAVLATRTIQLRGVGVHNLKQVDLDIPHRQLVVFCGVSGSGKSSLALDTLYAEGQRRYIESFSAYTRQFLERLEKPQAERIEGIPAAVAVTHKNTSRSSRSTVGTVTETADYLRLLYAKIGQVFCEACQREVRRDTPQSAARTLGELPAGARCLVAFSRPVEAGELDRVQAELREEGFVRAVVAGRLWRLEEPPTAELSGTSPASLLVVVDRLVAGQVAASRVQDSLETAMGHGDGRCVVLVDCDGLAERPVLAGQALPAVEVDGRPLVRIGFSRELECGGCQRRFRGPEPRLFSFNSPLGACPDCEGFGNLIDVDMDLVVPDPQKSLGDGAIAPWNTPAYVHELHELLALAPDYDLPVDVPYSQLDERQRRLIEEGVPERKFGGLRGFFQWLERRKYKMHLRVFLSRWRSYRTCSTCQGGRLNSDALAVRIGGMHLADFCRLRIRAARDFLRGLDLEPSRRAIARMLLEQVDARLGYLEAVGLGYLTLDRTLRTLSGGEAQRVALTAALGSSLVNMLYVLDEPSVGLHPKDVDRLLQAIVGLRNRGNTVVVVEHEEAIIRAADQLIEIGPGAGDRGGQVVFQGTLAAMCQSPASLTGDYLAGRRGISRPLNRRKPARGWIRLTGARGNNLRNLDVEFPLGVLCLVTGVSGSGKSTLVQDTLYGALCARKRKEVSHVYPYTDVFGDGQIDDVLLVDQAPIGRSPRSNPVTYIKAFDLIRGVFADTVGARTHNYTAGHFSFNVDGGRCSACQGDGYIEIDMQFLADVYMKCSQCGGTRYRREILDVLYRGRNIAEVLEMTVREAFSFFRGQTKVQARLKQLIDVGLDYLRLGQPASTLSSGEAQRLKLAAHMSSASRNRTLFILDEPTTGLHFSDVVQLLDCFDALLAVGHSLIVVEHNLQLMRAADYILDLGPGAADEGGRLVAAGSPEQIAATPESVTGRFLAEALAVGVQEQSA